MRFIVKCEFDLKSDASKGEITPILTDNHYLRGSFKSGKNYALLKDDVIVGACIFTGLPVPELVVGMYGLERNDQKDFYELSRLVIAPHVQKSEHNITSWFVSRCLRDMKRLGARSILSYADDSLHCGTIYQACNFEYYGLADAKKDFWYKLEDGSYKKLNRGSNKGLVGEWRPRTRKHRYVMQFERSLEMKWTSQRDSNPRLSRERGES